MFFLLRGGFDANENLTLHLQDLTLKKVAHVTPTSALQLQTVSDIKTKDFKKPAQPDSTPMDMTADVHFHTFVAAFFTVLLNSMQLAPELCRTRTAGLRSEFDSVVTRVREYTD